MAGMKEIREHIASVKSTQKVTNAMYLISSSQMRRAREELARTRPFFDALSGEIGRIFRQEEGIKSPYFSSAGEEKGTYAYLVVTADRGLAGAYNQNVVRETLRCVEKHPAGRLFVIGERGRHLFKTQGISCEESFRAPSRKPTLHHARAIAAMLLDLYDRGEVTKIFVVYTDLAAPSLLSVRTAQLLPLESGSFSSFGWGEEEKINFYPSPEEVLAKLVPAYAAGFLYAALVDSFCAEQSARAAAMEAANENVEEMLRDLKLRYNHERQSAITQEITEVSAGARSREDTGKEARYAHR